MFVVLHSYMFESGAGMLAERVSLVPSTVCSFTAHREITNHNYCC